MASVNATHFAGLVAGGVFEGDEDPVEHAHVVTSTTHKTLRGPRGGIVLCKKEYAPFVDKGCPLVIGGPLSPLMERGARFKFDGRKRRGENFLDFTNTIKKIVDGGVQTDPQRTLSMLHRYGLVDFLDTIGARAEIAKLEKAARS